MAMETLRNTFSAVESFAQRHAVHLRRVSHVTHAAYFGLVAVHGAYHYPAMVMLFLIVVSWIFHFDLEE